MSKIVKAYDICLDTNKQFLINYKKPAKQNHRIFFEDQQRSDHKERVHETIIPYSTDDEIYKLKEEAALILSNAHMEADAMLSAASKECQQLHKEAQRQGYDCGYQEGLVSGRESGELDYKDKLEETSRVQEGLLKERQMIVKSCEQDMIQLSLDIAQKVLQREVSCNRAVIMSIIEGALLKIQNPSHITVTLSNSDYESIHCMEPEQSILDKKHAALQILCDEAMMPGDCIITTDQGTIDAGINTQMDQIKQSLVLL